MRNLTSARARAALSGLIEASRPQNALGAARRRRRPLKLKANKAATFAASSLQIRRRIRSFVTPVGHVTRDR